MLLILTAFAAFMVSFITAAHATGALAIQGARGFEAARAGIEWAGFQIKREAFGTTAGTPNLPNCFATPTVLAAPPALGDFAIQVSCQRFPAATAVPDYHEESTRRVVIYELIAPATSGTPGTSEYIERRLEARIEKCKDPSAAAPAFSCL